MTKYVQEIVPTFQFSLPACCIKEVNTEICKTTNLPVVSYEGETLSLAFRRKHSLRVSS
jgi:hypothetical protein